MEIKEKHGIIVGKPAPDFTLQNQAREYVNLNDVLDTTPIMLAFYSKSFGPVCQAQFSNYIDHLDQFNELGVRIIGVSANDPDGHQELMIKHELPFTLLSDPSNRIAKKYGCTSIFMLGNVSRAIFLINTSGLILYRYVEPTTYTSRKSDELLQVIRQLRQNDLI